MEELTKTEKQKLEFKDLQKIRTGDKGFRDLAVTCVAFANAQGGQIFIGYDDKLCAPKPNQQITEKEANDAATRIRELCSSVAISTSGVLKDVTGSQYFIITVLPSVRTIATTSDGKIYLRVADKSVPVRSEDLQSLMETKGNFQWEILKTKFPTDANSLLKLNDLANRIRSSERAKESIRQMDDMEIGEIYHLIDDDILTNLGVLWLGTPKQRASICYPNSVQYIVYDALENKVRKVEWHDNTLAPDELLLEIEKNAIELTYSYEFPNGLFRKQIRQYHPKLIRELLVNAVAHRSYTISKDIMIEVYPSRLEISSPGGFPFGVTRDNILHEKMRRNPNMIDLLYVLKLMEGEGSGYDLIYQLNATEMKNQPNIVDSYSEVKVIQSAEIVEPELLPLLDYVLKNYPLSQKALTAFGIIARGQKMTTLDLSQALQLNEEERLKSYVHLLLQENLIIKGGVKKGTCYYINPKLIKNAKAGIKTTLKTVEPHVLKTLVYEDLRIHPNSGIRDILERLKDADIRDVRKILYAGVESEKLEPHGASKNRTYSLIK
jgi:ATP-dependent DNA helicase RecG